MVFRRYETIEICCKRHAKYALEKNTIISAAQIAQMAEAGEPPYLST